MTGNDPHESEMHVSRLLVAASAGDQSAWRELVDLYARRVFALAKSRCRDADVAEEIAQSVFSTLAAKVGAGEYREQGRFEAWLFRVAMNRVRDHVRRARRRPETREPEVMDQRPGRAEFGVDAATLGRLREAMEKLSDADREVVELRHHGGMSFKQMSDMLEEPIGTLLARHHRALKKLKELLEPDPMTATRGEHLP